MTELIVKSWIIESREVVRWKEIALERTLYGSDAAWSLLTF